MNNKSDFLHVISLHKWCDKAIIINAHSAEFDKDRWRSTLYHINGDLQNSGDNMLPRHACVQLGYACRSGIRTKAASLTVWIARPIEASLRSRPSVLVSGNAIRVCTGTWHIYAPKLHAASIKAEAKSLHVRCIYIWEHDDLSLLVCDRIIWQHLTVSTWHLLHGQFEMQMTCKRTLDYITVSVVTLVWQFQSFEIIYSTIKFSKKYFLKTRNIFIFSYIWWLFIRIMLL